MGVAETQKGESSANQLLATFVREHVVSSGSTRYLQRWKDQERRSYTTEVLSELTQKARSQGQESNNCSLWYEEFRVNRNE